MTQTARNMMRLNPNSQHEPQIHFTCFSFPIHFPMPHTSRVYTRTLIECYYWKCSLHAAYAVKGHTGKINPFSHLRLSGFCVIVGWSRCALWLTLKHTESWVVVTKPLCWLTFKCSGPGRETHYNSSKAIRTKFREEKKNEITSPQTSSCYTEGHQAQTPLAQQTHARASYSKIIACQSCS